MPEAQSGNIQVVVRRRTRRHRRNRAIRRWLGAAVIAIFAAGISTLALTYFSPSLFHARQSLPFALQQNELSRNRAVTLNQVLSQAPPQRPVYPYSVVPGGVEDAKELKWVAEHDPIVGAHYAGFDYAHAQVVRLTLARTVYVSYRIGNRIYWDPSSSHAPQRRKADYRRTNDCPHPLRQSSGGDSAAGRGFAG